MSNKEFYVHLLSHDRQIKAKSGMNLMEALMAQSIFLRSDCGGKGVCKKCRVKLVSEKFGSKFENACKLIVSKDISIEIPESSMLSSHIISKAAVSLPETFENRFKNVEGKDTYGIGVDLGTTTIAVYLCNMTKAKIVSSLAVKNPQALYGDDVMSRISAIDKEEKNLVHLQNLVVRAIEWGIKEVSAWFNLKEDAGLPMVVVGNPAMIHMFAGVDPKPIGVSPYQPVFHEAKKIQSNDIGFKMKNFSIQLLPQVSGFIGGDILSAALAVDLENQPKGTLLVDLGTNGELMLKGKKGFFATSCATGPAFEGAALSCGIQAIPGAINKIKIKNVEDLPEYTIINPSNLPGLKPSGICGTGVISALAQFCKKKIIDPGGAFQNKIKQYIIVPENSFQDDSGIFITQKDIRSVQLGKGALITGIEFLLKEAGFEKPEKIIIAGAFGSFLDKKDMMTLGMIPVMDPDQIQVSGNSAGAGAIMVLCDTGFLDKAIQMAAEVNVVDLACNQDFQDIFVEKLRFPVPGN